MPRHHRIGAAGARTLLFLTTLLVWSASPTVLAAGPAPPADEAAETSGKPESEFTVKSIDEDLTLERLFPEKSVFGPSANRTSFSHDGRFGAYLYRPYIERRHGADLWIYDTETGETHRITSVSVMAPFQKSTRTVRDDRVKKAGKSGGKKSDDADKPAGPDPVTGTWEGRVTGNDDNDLVPPDGTLFTLEIRLSDGQVSGTMNSDQGTADVEEGSWDPETKQLRCVLRVRDLGLVAVLEVEIEDDYMEGDLVIEELGATLGIEATRIDDSANGDSEEDDDTDDSDDSTEADDADDEEVDLGDVVNDKDADDDKAPRYGGVQSYEWSPDGHELIFTSAGDLYRCEIPSGDITRLTRTREYERDVQYLPDGSGYTYLRGGDLLRVSWGSHLIEQLDPRLPRGETMGGYRISPDQTRLVFLANEGESYWGRGRQVNIVNYRDRFAQVRQVTRHVSDDPFTESKTHVYLHELADNFEEEHEPKKVFTFNFTGPRDILLVPEWAPDSSRIAFAAFAQDTGHVEIREARFVEPEEADDRNDEPEDAESEDASDDKSSTTIEDSRVVYRFLHNGGPTTPRMIRPWYLPDSRRLAFITELSGFRHVHVLDPVYEQLTQLTQGRYEVYPFDISEDHERLFVEATKGDPTQQHIFALDLESGDMTQLTSVEGHYSRPAVSDDGLHVLASHIDFGSLRELVAIDVDAGSTTPLTDSHPDEARAITEPEPDYFTFENRVGQTIHGHMFRPDDWSPDETYPLLIYVYGGPLGTTKMVTRGSLSSPGYFFAYYMAKKHGYITCSVDPRGASGYGALFEKANYEQVGKPQVEDLVDAARFMIDNHGVDAERVALHGWSFGGFQTQMCMYTEPEVFAVGIAGAGPTEWQNYNSWYSTGTVGPTRRGHPDLEAYSLLPLAKNLQGRLLLVHGMEDSNVLYQDTVRVYRELLKAGKESLVDLFLDPTGGHHMGGDVKTIGWYRKYEDYLLLHIGEGPMTDAATDSSEEDAAEASDADTEDGEAEEAEDIGDKVRDIWQRLKMSR